MNQLLIRFILSLICFGDFLIHVALVVGILVFAHSKLGVVVTVVAINIIPAGGFGFGNNYLHVAQFVGINFFAHCINIRRIMLKEQIVLFNP